MEVKVLTKIITEVIDKKKGEDIVILNVSKISDVTDYFIICTALNKIHILSLIKEVKDALKKEGIKPINRDNCSRGTKWGVLDYGSVIAHFFIKEIRDYYDLEGNWEAGKLVKFEAKIVRRKGNAKK